MIMSCQTNWETNKIRKAKTRIKLKMGVNLLFTEDITFLRTNSAVLFQFRPSGKSHIEKAREETNPRNYLRPHSRVLAEEEQFDFSTPPTLHPLCSWPRFFSPALKMWQEEKKELPPLKKKNQQHPNGKHEQHARFTSSPSQNKAAGSLMPQWKVSSIAQSHFLLLALPKACGHVHVWWERVQKRRKKKCLQRLCHIMHLRLLRFSHVLIQQIWVTQINCTKM